MRRIDVILLVMVVVISVLLFILFQGKLPDHSIILLIFGFGFIMGLVKLLGKARKTGVQLLIFCLYGFPFVYFSMYQDFANYTMLGYLLMIAATALLAFIGRLFSNGLPFILGNLASGIISFYFIGEMAGNERWGGYFKPLSPYQLLLLVTILNLIPQLFTVKLAKKYRHKVKQ